MWFWTAISVVAAVLQIVFLFLAERRKGTPTRRRAALVGLSAFLTLTVGFSVYQATENDRYRDARERADELLVALPQLPGPRERALDGLSNGELQGILLAGLAFLDFHREDFPDAYKHANRVYRPLAAPSWDRTQRARQKRRIILVEAASGMLGLIYGAARS
ncbi:MAG: hypothetical protein M3340_00350 [Actinomycetota bacterium]|nr:hypothetical protein [Actinomycetota bacterium]